MENVKTKPSSIFVGVAGYWLGGILGNLVTYLIAISGLLGWLIGIIPPEQSLVRLFFAIVLAFATVGAGGAVTGIFNG
jgi:hypothetical protein